MGYGLSHDCISWMLCYICVTSSYRLFEYIEFVGPGSSVGIATCYGLDSPESNPRGVEIFRTCLDRPWALPSFLYNEYRVFPGGKERPGRDANPSPLSSADGHKRVKLYLYSPCGPYGLYKASVPVQGWPLPLYVWLGICGIWKYPLVVQPFNSCFYASKCLSEVGTP